MPRWITGKLIRGKLRPHIYHFNVPSDIIKCKKQIPEKTQFTFLEPAIHQQKKLRSNI